MNYMNARKGIQKIFIGEILTLVSTFIFIIATLIAFRIKGASSLAAGMSSGGLVLLSSVLMLAAFFFTIFGAAGAARDEVQFKNAMAAMMAGIIANIAQNAAAGRGTVVEGLFTFVGTFCQFLVTYYIVSGMTNLARSLHDSAMQEAGLKTLKLVLIIYAVILVLNVISTILNAKSHFTGGIIMDLIASVFSIAASIIYLRMLYSTKQMLS